MLLLGLILIALGGLAIVAAVFTVELVGGDDRVPRRQDLSALALFLVGVGAGVAHPLGLLHLQVGHQARPGATAQGAEEDGGAVREAGTASRVATTTTSTTTPTRTARPSSRQRARPAPRAVRSCALAEPARPGHRDRHPHRRGRRRRSRSAVAPFAAGQAAAAHGRALVGDRRPLRPAPPGPPPTAPPGARRPSLPPHPAPRRPAAAPRGRRRPARSPRRARAGAHGGCLRPRRPQPPRRAPARPGRCANSPPGPVDLTGDGHPDLAAACGSR